MTEFIEQENKELEGELSSPNTHTRYFKSFSALSDFCQVFGIKSGQFGYGFTEWGTKAYILQYRRGEQ